MDLNTVLIILGVLVLIVLIAHAIWSNRREKSQYFNNANTFNRQPNPEESSVKPDFMQTEQLSVQPKSVEDIISNPTTEPVHVKIEEEQTIISSSQDVGQIKITLPDNKSELSEQKVYYEYIPESRPSSSNIADKTLMELADYENTEEGIHSISSDLRIQLQDAVLQSSPLSQPTLQQPIQVESEIFQEKDMATQNEDNLDFILLYVVAPENRQFHGTNLAHSLDNLGCLFGKDNIYHRHVDTIATPVIFSIANVNQPGTFNPYAMNDFFTVGVALFMQIPSIIGDDKANLRMMIQAAKNLANELGGFVLTDGQQLFDEKAEQEYLSRLM